MSLQDTLLQCPGDPTPAIAQLLTLLDGSRPATSALQVQSPPLRSHPGALLDISVAQTVRYEKGEGSKNEDPLDGKENKAEKGLDRPIDEQEGKVCYEE